MTYLVRVTLFLLVGAVFVGCSGWTSSSGSSGVNSDKIVISELSMSVTGMSVYEVVEQTNSHWLRQRGQKSIRNPNPIRVYVEGNKAAGRNLSALKGIRAENVASVEHLDASEAQMRFGMDNSSGAIVVNMKSGG